VEQKKAYTAEFFWRRNMKMDFNEQQKQAVKVTLANFINERGAAVEDEIRMNVPCQMLPNYPKDLFELLREMVGDGLINVQGDFTHDRYDQYIWLKNDVTAHTPRDNLPV
jgi:hypothetical protein